MIVLFHMIFFIFDELSTPVWQKEVRQITSQVVEAMREAEETIRLDRTLVHKYYILCSMELCDEILLFLVSSGSLHFGSFRGKKRAFSALTELIFLFVF